jgi:SAM-dependent methyltransferase
MAGLEIGALDRPTVVRSAGNIRFVDYRTADELRRCYAGQPAVDPGSIVDVDIVLGDRSLLDVLGHEQRLDYVVASHVIEHVPDVIGWLQQISAVLKPGGRLCLAIPDKHFTFDYLGTVSTFGDFLDAHLNRRTAPSVKQVYDFFRTAAHVSPVRAWLGLVAPGRLEHWSTAEDALQKSRERQAGEAIEVHCFLFTPASFLSIFRELVTHALTDFRIARFCATAPFEIEFFVTLEKLAAPDRGAQLASIPRPPWRPSPLRVLGVLAVKAARKIGGRIGGAR